MLIKVFIEQLIYDLYKEISFNDISLVEVKEELEKASQIIDIYIERGSICEK